MSVYVSGSPICATNQELNLISEQSFHSYMIPMNILHLFEVVKSNQTELLLVGHSLCNLYLKFLLVNEELDSTTFRSLIIWDKKNHPSAQYEHRHQLESFHRSN